MGLFDKIKGCTILKEGSNAESEILELKEILETCPESEKGNIEKAIRNLEYGIKGDNIGEEFYGCSNFPKCRNIMKKNEVK